MSVFNIDKINKYESDIIKIEKKIIKIEIEIKEIHELFAEYNTDSWHVAIFENNIPIKWKKYSVYSIEEIKVEKKKYQDKKLAYIDEMKIYINIISSLYRQMENINTKSQETEIVSALKLMDQRNTQCQFLSWQWFFLPSLQLYTVMKKENVSIGEEMSCGTDIQISLFHAVSKCFQGSSFIYQKPLELMNLKDSFITLSPIAKPGVEHSYTEDQIMNDNTSSGSCRKRIKSTRLSINR